MRATVGFESYDMSILYYVKIGFGGHLLLIMDGRTQLIIAEIQRTQQHGKLETPWKRT